jgi:mannan endo-1,4-beta-mannosidase
MQGILVLAVSTAATSAVPWPPQPADPQANAATRSLLARLAQVSAAPQLQMALGQQRANQQGRGWEDMSGDANRSDILTATGDWPAVFGFNFGSVINGNKQHSEKIIPEYIKAINDVGALGGIVAAHFPTNNPLGCSNSTAYKNCQKDPTGEPMKNLLPGRAGNKQWNAWLDLVAVMCNGVAPTPVLFRPFHENYLNNWWGAPYCTPSEFKAGWQYTVDYLRNTRNVHNLLLVYAPNQPSFSITSPLGYEERWPGDGYADIAAFDHYDHPPTPHHCTSSNFSAQFLQDLHMVVKFATSRAKVPAIAEFGIKKGLNTTLDADWWTRCFLDPIAADPLASKVAYAMTWTNSGSGASPNSGFVPLKGDFTFSSFQTLFKSNHTLFLRAWLERAR